MDDQTIFIIVFVGILIFKVISVFFNVKLPDEFDEIFDDIEETLEETEETIDKVNKLKDRFKKGGK